MPKANKQGDEKIKVGTLYLPEFLCRLEPYNAGSIFVCLLASLLSFRPARRPGNITPKQIALKRQRHLCRFGLGPLIGPASRNTFLKTTHDDDDVRTVKS